MKLTYDFYRSILVINKNLTKDIFLGKAAVKESGFAKEMFSRMYDSIFSELIDLEREYEKYYSKEYEKFEVFLYKKYNLEAEGIEALMDLKAKNDDYKIYKMEDYSYGDYSLGQFTFSETIYDRIMNILLLKN